MDYSEISRLWHVKTLSRSLITTVCCLHRCVLNASHLAQLVCKTKDMTINHVVIDTENRGRGRYCRGYIFQSETSQMIFCFCGLVLVKDELLASYLPFTFTFSLLFILTCSLPPSLSVSLLNKLHFVSRDGMLSRYSKNVFHLCKSRRTNCHTHILHTFLYRHAHKQVHIPQTIYNDICTHSHALTHKNTYTVRTVLAQVELAKGFVVGILLPPMASSVDVCTIYARPKISM